MGKKYLILSSSGGGGHIAAAKGKRDELIAKGISKDDIIVVDLMGLDKSIASNQSAWIPTLKGPISGTEYFSGKANTETWDNLQKAGGIESVRALEGLVDKQWIAEKIQYGSVYTNMKAKLSELKDDELEIFDTQALSTPAICQAIAEHNKENNKSISVTKIVTEFLTHRAVHFLDPLSRIAPEHRAVLKVQVVEPPLTGPSESVAEFNKSHGVDGIAFEYLSEQNIEPPVRAEFKQNNYAADKKILIKAETDEKVNEHNAKAPKDKQKLAEQAYLKAQFAGSPIKVNGNDIEITKEPNDKLITITMGSQGSSTILAYVDKFIEQANKAGKVEGNVYLCIAAGKNEGASLYEMVRKHIEGKQLPANFKILPLAFQDGKHMASLLQNSDILVTRSGGMSSIEAKYTQKIAKKRVVYVHSEQRIEDSSSFPSHCYDAVYERLLPGTVRWEGGNAEYLMKAISASLGSPDSVNFGFSGEVSISANSESLFHYAFAKKLNKDNLGNIEKILKKGSNPNLRLPDGSIAIEHCSDFETLKLMVSYGGKIKPDFLEKLVTSNAVTRNEAMLLIKAEEDFKAQLKEHTGIIHEAFKAGIIAGDIEVVKGLLHRFGKIRNHDLNPSGKLYVSPEQLAVKENKLEILELLIKSTNDIDKTNAQGSALHYAVENNNIEAVKLLLKYGASAQTKFKGKTPIELLEGKDASYLPLLNLFIEKGLIDPTLDLLPKVVGMKVEQLEELTYQKDNHFGNTKLHEIVYYANKGEAEFKKHFGDVTFDEMLRDNLELLNTKNKYGLTPLALCSNQVNRRVLVRYGADFRECTNLSKNEKAELMNVALEISEIQNNCRKALLKSMSKTKDEFTNSIINNIKELSEKRGEIFDEAKENAVREKCSEFYDELSAHKNKLETSPALVKFLEFIKKIIGIDSMKEFSSSLSKKFRTALEINNSKENAVPQIA